MALKYLLTPCWLLRPEALQLKMHREAFGGFNLKGILA